MADDEAMQFWLSVMGHSDEEESDFEGFSLEEIQKKDESDIDLDLVVNNDQLLAKFESDTSDDDRPPADDGTSGSDSDIELPTVNARKRKRASKKVRDAVTVHWSDRTQPVQPKKRFAAFDENEVQQLHVGVSHELPVGASPYDYFSLLLPEHFWQTMSEETNRYALQRQEEKEDKNWQPTTPEDMKLFIFIQFMFGIHHLPETNMYWSTDPLLAVPAVANVMSRNRFNKINQYFHLNDNTKAVPKGEVGYDPLFKVRPLLDTVLKNSRDHYYPGQDVSIDEAMVKFNGRLSFKQYIKGKPNPWGIKVWCAADPRSGFMLEFDVYLGRVLQPMPLGLGYHVIMNVGQRFLNKGHHLFFDNYFSSVKLAKDLEEKDTYMTATIRMNRKGWPKDLNTAFVKKMKVGDVHYRQDGNLVATLWKDKRPVSILSTNAQPVMGTEQRRAPGGKREKNIPQPVMTYNHSMGGVDLADQYSSYYSVGRPSIRWWRYLCWWLLQTAMVNAFIIWKHSNLPAPTKRGHRYLDFRLEVLRALCKGNSTRQRAPHQSVSQAGMSAADPLTHTISRLTGLKKNCFVCEKAKKKTGKGYSVTDDGDGLCCLQCAAVQRYLFCTVPSKSGCWEHQLNSLNSSKV